MIRPRWHKVLHDLWDSKSRTALVVFSIVVGVFSIGVIVGAYVILSHDMSISYAANNPANIEIRAPAFDNTLVKSVQEMSGIAQAEGRRVFTMQARIPGQTKWVALNVVSIDDFAKQTRLRQTQWARRLADDPDRERRQPPRAHRPL